MIILHGEDQLSSRNKLSELTNQARARGDTIINLPGDSLTLEQLIQVSANDSLFGNNTFLVIESIYSRRPSEDKKILTEYIELNQKGIAVVWEPKDVSSQLKTIDARLIAKFDLPKHIFKFLDNPSLETLHLALSTAPVEQVYASLATRLHKVLLGQGRFTRKLSFDQLSAMNHDLLAIDYRQKTSSAPYDLTAALELWLAKT